MAPFNSDIETPWRSSLQMTNTMRFTLCLRVGLPFPTSTLVSRLRLLKMHPVTDIFPDLHTTFSPSACVVAMLGLDGSVKIEKMQYLLTILNDIKEDDRRFPSTLLILSLTRSSKIWISYRCTGASAQLGLHAIQKH
jgi:hypothetical protein